MIITSDINRKHDPYDASRSVVAIPKEFDQFQDHISKVIFSDRVMILDYISETGFIIENERYARYEEKLFRLLFDLLEKREKKSES